MTTPFSTAAVLQTVGWTLPLDQDNVWSEKMQLTFEGGRVGGIRGNVEHDGDMKEQWPAPVDSLEVGCRPARPALGEVPGPGQTHLMAQFYFLPLTLTRGRQEIGNTWLGGRGDKEDKENWEDTKRRGRQGERT